MRTFYVPSIIYMLEYSREETDKICTLIKHILKRQKKINMKKKTYGTLDGNGCWREIKYSREVEKEVSESSHAFKLRWPEKAWMKISSKWGNKIILKWGGVGGERSFQDKA